MRIGVRGEVPELPENLSSKGKDFLGKCFANDPSKRWTAEMLLNHPFVDDQDFDNTVTLKERHDEDKASTSPRCPFGFPDWTFTSFPSPEYSSESGSWFCKEVNLTTGSMSIPPVERL
ncbi:Hypothetical predicted protein [Olea europaea subsp. europaea]|uniref:Uncharacterized protein n=1 Tax=Olea europaea subsp. europaea TaxID=158383 RepID=A0A8S0PFD3_OLEEU|nr:Hypothetical predicted protein [Olea europaea subsp. europaea]